jgi:hypothetical protein
MPLELKLRGKSTTMSHRSAIFFVDLVVRTGLTLEQAIAEAIQREEARRTAGVDQQALDEAAKRGFANGAFEDLAEDVPSVVEEFYPQDMRPERDDVDENMPGAVLRGKLEGQVARLAKG